MLKAQREEAARLQLAGNRDASAMEFGEGTMLTALLATLLMLQQESDADRIKRLEEQSKKQQAEIDELKKKQDNKPQGEDEFTVSFTDGLHFMSKDGAFDLHAGGRYLEHLRLIASRPDGSRTSPNTFFDREAFLRLEGTLWQDWGFRVTGDFASSSTGSTTSLEEAWVSWKHLKELTFTFGQFKAPMSQDTLSSFLFVDEIERSIMSRFVPNFDIGIMALGSLWDGKFSYWTAVMNGRSHLSSGGRSTNDDNSDKEWSVRVKVAPWVDDKESPIKGLSLALYGSLTHTSGVDMGANFDITTTELGVKFLDLTTGTLQGRRWRLGVELMYAVGPFAFEGEYLHRSDELVGAGNEEDLGIDAGYVGLAWIVTGEEKTIGGRLVPANPFDIANGKWGAIELVARVGFAKIGNEVEEVGNSLTGNSDRVTTWTFGVNWYLVKNVRISASFIFEDYRDDVDFAGDDKSHLFGFLMRFQVDF